MPDHPIDRILDALQERAKELHCLYQVTEILARPALALDEMFREVTEAIPAGWRFPNVCWARITFEKAVYQPAHREETPWVQRAPIVVDGSRAGTLEVFYERPMPPADEGPFLKEERRLIDAIAERIGQAVVQRRLQTTLRHVHDASDRPSEGRRDEWRIILDFLRETDPQLVGRIARRMLNYLSWQGVAEAQALLHRLTGGGRPSADADENRPSERARPDEMRARLEQTFRIAVDHLSEQDIVSSIQKWIKDDRSAFLLEAVENQGTPLREIGQALERFQHAGIEEHELSRAIQIGLRAGLIRRFLTDDLTFVATARRYVEVRDFHELVPRVISPPRSHGRLGGKSSGLFLAARIVARSTEYADSLGTVKTPKTWYVTSDGLLSFAEFNQLQDLYNVKYAEVEHVRAEYPHVVQVFKTSPFPPEMASGLSLALDDFGDHPLIVRSSSLLEDRGGSVFSGKYKSLFLANQGSKAERLSALMDAVAEVYASVFGPEPIEYRAERGLLDVHEEMGVMIQEVVGTRVGRYFLPAWAGVAFSRNEFRWSPRIRREDGVVRLVPGLGTRAVDRVADDFPILIAPGQPGLRASTTPEEMLRYSPRAIDAIDLEARRFDTIPIEDLLRDHAADYPSIRHVISIYEDEHLRRASPLDLAGDPKSFLVTFDGLIADTPFVARIRTLLRLLEDKMGTPVDVEFASDGEALYLLQCRPQGGSADSAPPSIPRDIPRDRLVFTATRHVSSGRIPDATHVVYVDPDAYRQLDDATTLQRVGRAVGRLNRILPKRQFILMGPGRWGSRGDIRLGVDVGYSDINKTSLLIEIARRRGNYTPELSFGTHFFQDLVESGIRYLPLYPDDEGSVFNEGFLRRAPNLLPALAPDFADLQHVVHVVDITAATDGQVLRVLMNGDLDEAVAFVAPPGGGVPVTSAARGRQAPAPDEDHWRWRLRMAERIAAELDAARFGVQGLYLFGSTKNAVAGPGSDIDLIVHVRGTEEMRAALETWLDGWSACLAEMNYLRTGYRTDRLLDVHVIGDEDIERRTSYAAKINAVTDAARELTITKQ